MNALEDRFKTGKAHNEQNISGLPPIADIARQFLEQVGGQPAEEPSLSHAPSAWPHRTNLWRNRTNPRKGSERLTGIGPMMWKRENASLLLQHLSHMQSERGRCSIRSANLGPGLARPPAPTAGAFFFGEFVTSTAPAPQSEPLPGSPRRRASPRLLWLTQQSRDFKDADRPQRANLA